MRYEAYKDIYLYSDFTLSKKYLEVTISLK